MLDLLRADNVPADRIRLVANDATNVRDLTARDLATLFGRAPDWDIPYDRAIPRATQRGRPVVIDAPHSRAARRLRDLAPDLTGARPPAAARSAKRARLAFPPFGRRRSRNRDQRRVA